MKRTKLLTLLTALGALICCIFTGCAVTETDDISEINSFAAADVIAETEAVTEATATTDAVTEIPAPKMFTVTFDPGIEGFMPVNVEVEEGTAAVAPEFEVPYMKLLGWDKKFSDVTQDMTVTALWEKRTMSGVEISEYSDSRIATVYVHDKYGNDGSGSGFFIDDKGTFITNYHVIELADSISIELNTGAKYRVDKIINFSEKYDLAILKVDIAGNDYFEFADKVVKGEKVYAIGSALGELNGSITGGIVSSPSRKVGVIDCIQMDAAISNGNSGGPLVNEYGEVVGINSFSFTQGQSLNLAINAAMLDELPDARNFSVSDYVEWWRTEIERSYRPTDSSDESYFKFSIVNTYQNVTGDSCLLSLNDLDEDSDEYVKGYNSDYLFYIYDYNIKRYDEYVKYLKELGFEYSVENSETYDDAVMSIYYNASSNLAIMLCVTNEKSFLEAEALIISIMY